MKKKKLSDMLISMYKYGGNLEEPPSDRLRTVNSDELKRIEAIEKAKLLKHQQAMNSQDGINYQRGDYRRNAHPSMVNLTNTRNNEQLENWSQQALPKSVEKALGYIADGRGVMKALSPDKAWLTGIVGATGGIAGTSFYQDYKAGQKFNEKKIAEKENSFKPLFDVDELYNKNDNDTVGYLRGKPVSKREFKKMPYGNPLNDEYINSYSNYSHKKLIEKYK